MQHHTVRTTTTTMVTTPNPQHTCTYLPHCDLPMSASRSLRSCSRHESSCPMNQTRSFCHRPARTMLAPTTHRRNETSHRAHDHNNDDGTTPNGHNAASHRLLLSLVMRMKTTITYIGMTCERSLCCISIFTPYNYIISTCRHNSR